MAYFPIWKDGIPIFDTIWFGTSPLTIKFAGDGTSPLTLTNSGQLTTLDSILSGGNVALGSASYYLYWPSATRLGGPADGQLNLTNYALTAGIGLDFATDGVLKIRTRAQTGDGVLAASAILGGSTTTQMASGSTSNLGTSNTVAHVFVTTSTGAAAFFTLNGPQSTTVEIADSDGMFTAVGATTNNYNIYWDSTDATYSIENRTGATGSITVLKLGRA